ncbi:dnaJ protein ERDJ3A isoform X1 [Cynara cardunculus var. scolymus]|uniref:DnaJ domain-containing protein n=1 Tax=Cynara cardunculus var. scolymus TaxID=59895 RepID=A0A103YM06_CYNCS|nr:dnaJ protein ERDJ3A isoform X1 [Cynara cardunculus var. scolymus]KVI11485.1 DnaJ domain-containing protein [Cynara cardunculus var. scolymus]
MKNSYSISIFFICLFLLVYVSVESKSLDPYKVLGVEKDASQRQIQKAFHKLSLQYHPDKNKNKGAQEKFAEINNAYDILSDEEKRKNYDMYGDARGNPGFDGGDAQGGHSYFRSGGPGHSRFAFRPDEWQTMGGEGGSSKSYSFSFGGGSSDSSFGFDLGDVFSNFFGGGMSGGSQFGGFGNSGSGSSPKSLTSINSQLYKKEIIDKGVTWLLLSYKPTMSGIQHYESITEEVASSLKGALEVGSVNCEVDSALCKELGILPRSKPRLYVYSYKASETGSLLEYTGGGTVKDLKLFVQDHLPKFSKRVTLAQFEATFGTVETLPKAMLLSTKKDTPVIWRALSGLYRKRFIFYDTQVQDVSDPIAKKLGVDALPAVVGWLSNGEKQILKSGIPVKDTKSTIRDLSSLLDGFEKKNKKIASTQSNSDKEAVPLLTAANFDAICGEKTPVCIIGVFRSSKGREKLRTILSSVSQKSLVRRQNVASGPRDSVSYGLLDGSTQSWFLYAFDKSGFKTADRLLIAYKPRKSKFAAFAGDITSEEVERFIGSVLNGDVEFSKTRQKPTPK